MSDFSEGGKTWPFSATPYVPARRDPKMELHSHPRMEHELGVPKGHVIIDYPVFFELVQIHGRYVGRKQRV